MLLLFVANGDFHIKCLKVDVIEATEPLAWYGYSVRHAMLSLACKERVDTGTLLCLVHTESPHPSAHGVNEQKVGFS